MTNTELLKNAIKQAGVTMTFIADTIGISRHSLYSKIENDTEFKASEIVKIAEVLHLSDAERDSIFFAR